MSGDGDSTGAGGTKGAPRRRAARLAAVQALYQMALSGGEVEAVIAEFIKHRLHEDLDGLTLDDIDQALFGDLIRGVQKEAEQLDDMLSAVLAADWPIERLERILRVILQAGTYELEHYETTPARVIIAEYVGLTDDFFLGKEPALANGVLDRIARVLRPEEFPDAVGSPLEGLA